MRYPAQGAHAENPYEQGAPGPGDDEADRENAKVHARQDEHGCVDHGFRGHTGGICERWQNGRVLRAAEDPRGEEGNVSVGDLREYREVGLGG